MNYPKFIKPFDIEAKRAEIIAEFKRQSGKLDYIPLVGDDYMTLIDIFLFQICKIIEFVNYQVANNYINFSSGEYLDELVALIGLKRIRATKPIATIQITATTATFLAKGTKFISESGEVAFLLDNTFINTTATAKLELNEYSDTNPTTNRLEVPNPYISSIDIIEPFKGYKADESDKELRERFLLSLHRFSTAGSEQPYKFFILSTEGIKKTAVYRQSAGVVMIVFLTALDEAVATQKIKESLKGRIPLTDQIMLKPAIKINCDLSLKVRLKDSLKFSSYITKATQKLKELFNSLEIGQSLHHSKIIETAFISDDIVSVEVLSQIPQTNQDSILTLGSVNIQRAEYA